MTQIQSTKITKFVTIGADPDEIAVAKVVAYMVLEPGEQTPGDTTRQGHIHAQVIRRR